MKFIILKNLCKTIWFAAVLAFLFVYAYKKREAMFEAIALLETTTVMIAILLIVVGKLGLVFNMRFAARQFSIALPWWECFRIYNLTQLAKYIPGSIWQFVGRVAVLKDRGVDGRRIRDSITAEHLWVIGVSGIMGLFLTGLYGIEALRQWRESLSLDRLPQLHLGLIPIIAGAFFIALWFFRARIMRILGWSRSLLPSIPALCALVMTWCLFGASLWITMRPFSEEVSLLYVVGVYCVAYVVGFFVPFAPAGLGIREACIVVALTPSVGADFSVLLAAINRVLYFFSEIFLAGVSFQKGLTRKVNLDVG